MTNRTRRYPNTRSKNLVKQHIPKVYDRMDHVRIRIEGLQRMRPPLDPWDVGNRSEMEDLRAEALELVKVLDEVLPD